MLNTKLLLFKITIKKKTKKNLNDQGKSHFELPETVGDNLMSRFEKKKDVLALAPGCVIQPLNVIKQCFLDTPQDKKSELINIKLEQENRNKLLMLL